jgi:hypothetical protein
MSIKALFVVGVAAAVLVPGCGSGDSVWLCQCSGADNFDFSTQICASADPVTTAEAQCKKAGGSGDDCGIGCTCGDLMEPCTAAP